MTTTYEIRLRKQHAQSIYRLLIDSSITLYQLHQAILILFDYADEEPFQFESDDEAITWKDEEVFQPIQSWGSKHPFITYTYAEAQQEQRIEIQFCESDQSALHGITSLDQQPSDKMQNQFDVICSMQPVDEQQLADLLEDIRNELAQIKTIAPYLMIMHHGSRKCPFYLDVLDNGMELMIFPDENSFARSVLNSHTEDPDLLFTYAYTFDFLYDDIKESELPLFYHHILCFKNEPGRLPHAFITMERIFLYNMLQNFYLFILDHKHLASMGDRKMTIIDKDGTASEQPFCIQEELQAINMSIEDQLQFALTPHTNEHIRLTLQALPKDTSSNEIQIKLCAMNAQFHREQTVNMDSLTELGEDIYLFLKQLFKERGLMEAITVNSCNLYHMISELCDELQIHCSLYTPASANEGELLTLLCDSLGISQEELMMLDPKECPTYQVQYMN